MSTRIKSLKIAAVSAAWTCALIAPGSTLAAPGTLADSPLFLTNPVEPNILFLLDDSGSMDWGTMTPENNGLINLGCAYFYTQPAPDNDYFTVVPNEAGLAGQGIAPPFGGVWRAWSSSYNRLYYDPAVTYTPWSGADVTGTPFGNVNPAAALLDPFNPAAGVMNLTIPQGYWSNYCQGGLDWFWIANFYMPHHYVWTDSNTNGTVDPGDVHTLVEIRPTTPNYPNPGGARTDCASTMTCTYAEEIQNFANWFSYYRKREFVAKAAYGQVIGGASNARMGLVTLHNNNNVNEAIESMNDDPFSGPKEELLDELYQMAGAGGTPLRNAFDNAGRYLSCEGNAFFGSCPALSAANGGECQQNFTIMMTDGFYNGGFGGLGNADGDNNTAWDSANTGPFGDTQSDTLGDIAMEYYEDDIRPGTANNLTPPPGGVDENTAQHMVTYSVAFGVSGTVTAMPPNTTDPFTWPTPNTDPRRIDDLRHAAWNGRGDFYSAQDPTELITGLRGALASIQGRIGSSASVAFNTGSLSTNSEVYLALFNSERWNGDLLAFDLDPSTGAISSVPSWSAAGDLATRDLATNPRTILTYDGTDGVPFQWSQLTNEQKDDLRTNASGIQETVATGMARHAYIRGHKGCEFSSAGTCFFDDGTNTYTSKSLRERTGRLGDIVHSGPVFAGQPESNWPDVAPFPNTTGDTYTDFREANASRPGVIYVGGNDGMLHAFSQADGEEIMAYVPNEIYSDNTSDGLHYLTDPAYTHRYSVDLTPSIADVYIKTEPTGATGWKTVLVGGLRGGGRGLYALDVTDPTSFSEAGLAPAKTVMWEFTSNDDADLGHTFSRTSIVPLEGPGSTIRWAAIFGNGYNDQGSGEAKLFIVFLEGGLDGVWTPGTDYIEISTEIGTPANRNGLSTPAVIDTDGDGMADRAYAGDLRGNVWAFDLSGSTTGNWDVAYGGGTPEPLFDAPANQQITSTPVIVRNKAQVTSATNTPNTLVIFGTGQYLTSGDIVTTDTQAMYGVWDHGVADIDQGDLVEQDISVSSTTEGVPGRTLTDNSVDYLSKDGWYMELPEAGERLITDPVIRGDLLFFNTMIPDPNPCNFGGRGWLMVVDWLTGGVPGEVAFDINNDGNLDNLDEIDGEAAVGMSITGIATSPVNLANKRYTSTTETTGGSTINVTNIKEEEGPKTGRLSWEELTP